MTGRKNSRNNGNNGNSTVFNDTPAQTPAEDSGVSVNNDSVTGPATEDDGVINDFGTAAEAPSSTKSLDDAVMETPADDVEAMLSDINKSIDSLSGNTEIDAKVQVMKNSFNLTDKIPCKSLFHGKLVYTSPTNGSRYVWNEYGTVQHVPLVELESMNNHKPDILNKPLLLILEPKVVEDFNFGDVYRKVASFNKLSGYYNDGKLNVIRAKVRELIEVGMRDSVIADARKRRKENTLVDINIINMLKVELKCDIG
jgi:hypothetical protein